MTTYYVATNGSATNPGTLDRPLTLKRSLELAKAGDTVLIRGGTYREMMNPWNTGTATAPIVIKPYNNEKVVISGLQTISPGKNGVGNWQAHDLSNGKSIYKIRLPEGADLGEGNNQLFINGRMIAEARLKNTSDPLNAVRKDYTISTKGTVKRIIDTDPNDYYNIIEATYEHPSIKSYWKGGQINFASGSEWGGQSGEITEAVDGKVTFRFETYVTGYGDDPNKPNKDDPFLLSGRLEALDSAGEWYLDAKGEYGAANTLYLWTPNSQNPTNQNIEIKKEGVVLSLGGSYFQIKNLNFKGGTIWTGEESNNLVFDGITSEYASHSMSGQASAGIFLNGDNNKLINSKIFNTQGTGIVIKGENSRVEKNTVHHIGYDFVGWDGIAANSTDSKGSQILRNKVYHTIGGGISFGGLKQGKVNYNEVYRSGTHSTDIGAINAYGSENLEGTEVAYNWVHDINPYHNQFDPNRIDNHNGGFGIRIDSGGAENELSGVRIHHNRVSNVSSNAGIAIFQDPTTAIDSNKSIGVYNNTVKGDLFIGGKSRHRGTVFENNIFLGKIINYSNGEEIIRNNLDNTTNPQLVNPSKNDFRLKATSPAIDKATIIAGINNNVPDGKPDLGAIEYVKPTSTSTEDVTRYEAESLSLTTYKVESTDNSGASGGKYISLKNGGRQGKATGIFTGESGNYRVKVGYYDESDGQSSVSVTVGGEAASFQFDRDLPSTWAQKASKTSRITHESVFIKKGDRFELFGQQNGGECARFDYIEFISVGSLSISSLGIGNADMLNVADLGIATGE